AILTASVLTASAQKVIGQARSNPGDATESQPQSSHVVNAGPNLKHMDLKGTDALTQQNPKRMDEEFTLTAYPDVQENLKLLFDDQVILEDPTRSTGTLSSLQILTRNTVSLISSSWRSHRKKNLRKPILNLNLRNCSGFTPNINNNNLSSHDNNNSSTTTTSTITKHRRLDPIARHCDLPAIDMKEIIQQRMFEDKSYKDHEDHKNLFDALEKSLEHDYSNQLLSDLEVAYQKKRKRCDLPRTPFGSPHPQPLPPPPLAGASGALDTRKDWWKPLSKEERPVTPETAWTIPSSNVSDTKNNWASALVLTYEPPAENSFLATIGDMTTFVNWYCRKVNKTVLTQADFEGHAYEVVIAFYPDVIHLYFQMEEYLEYFQYGNKGSSHALSISKMKAARYPNFGLELLVLEQMWIDDVHDSPSRRKEVKTHMRILSVVRIKAYSRYGYDYLSEIVLRRANFQEHTIAEKDFKNMYPNDFEDPNLLLLQRHLNHLYGSDKRWDAKGYEFKDDYTIIESPRAVVFPINNNE
nr:hypothetical protein [Tanacetum cinerariifolium]